MTALAGFNIADLTDLVASQYIAAANQAFWEAAKLGIAVSSDPNHNRKIKGAQSYTLTQLGNLQGAITSATAADAASVSATTPTESQVAVSWDFRQKHVVIDAISEAGSFMDLAMSGMADLVAAAAATHDYLAATALASSTTADTYDYVGQSASTSITASDTLTAAYVRKAHAKLVSANAPQFLIPGIGLCYLAVVHSDVAHDLKAESSGIQLAVQNVNHPYYVGNVLGHALGFLFIESNSSALIEANGGDGNVDVYYNIFLGDRTLAKVRADVAPNPPTCEDIPLVMGGGEWGSAQQYVVGPDRSIIARRASSGENFGFVKRFGVAMQLGFALANPTGTYRVESASSLGANT